MKKLEKLITFLIIFLIITYLLLRIENMILSIKFIVLVVYLLTMILSYLKNRIIMFLFLGALFLFQYGRIILLPLFGYEIEMTFFHYIKIDLKTDIFITDLLFINLIGIFLGNLLPIKEKRNSRLKKEKNLKEKEIIIFILILLFIPFYLKFSFEILTILKKINYVDYYKIGMLNLNKSNILEKICYNIFLFTLPFGLSLKNLSLKKRIFLIAVNLLSAFLITMRGGRSSFLATLCFSIWYLNKEKILKINLKKLFLVVGFVFVLIIGLENVRNKKDFNSNNFTMIKIIERVIYSQGTTGTFLCLLNKKPEIFEKNKIPYIFSSVIGFRSKQQDEKTYNKIVNSENVVLANRMSTSLNKEIWLLGKGMGGNYLMEMYLFGGIISVIFLSALHTLCLIFIDKNYNNFSWLIRSFFILIIPKFFLIPRNNYFIYIPFIDIVKFFSVYFLIIISTQILKGVSHEKYKNNNIS